MTYAGATRGDQDENPDATARAHAELMNIARAVMRSSGAPDRDLYLLRGYAERAGVEMRGGGWVYLPGARKAIAQGWRGFAEVVVDNLTTGVQRVVDSMSEVVRSDTAKAERREAQRKLATSQAATLQAANEAEALRLEAERIEPGDLVTVDGADPRVWRVERFEPSNGYSTGEPWAALVHASGTRTSVPVKRLSHATATEIMGAKRAAATGSTPELVHYMSEYLLDACEQAPRGQRLVVTPVAADITCEPCKLIAAGEDRPPTIIGQGEFMARTADMDLPSLHDLDRDLMSRIVRRARYDVLRSMVNVVAGWIEGAQGNHEALGHRGEPLGGECWRSFAPDDIGRMINDAAREANCPEPYRPGMLS